MHIHYLSKACLAANSNLMRTMFQDRKKHFVDRLGWSELEYDENGRETDQYDELDPIYVVLELENGCHGGSLRLLPMNGPNMIHDHFQQILPRSEFRSNKILECTRFVVNRESPRCAADALFLGACQFFRSGNAELILGLFDQRMLRVYQRLNNLPTIINSEIVNDSMLSVGAWAYSDEVRSRVLATTGLNEKHLEKTLLAFLHSRGQTHRQIPPQRKSGRLVLAS